MAVEAGHGRGLSGGVFQRFRGLDSCAVSDALDVLGMDQVVGGLRPLWEGARLVGPAMTVQLAAGDGSPAVGGGVHLGVRAIEACGEGDVIVVANDGRVGVGCWGGLLSVAAVERHVGGVVLDGACRDVDEAKALGFAVFARDASLRTARGRVYEVSYGQPVRVGGVDVAPGDLVFGDGTGLVVVPQGAAEEVLVEAERIHRKEEQMAARVRAGQRLRVVLGGDYEAMARSRRGEV